MQVMPLPVRYSSTTWTWYSELGSAEQYSSPTVLVSGSSSRIMSACSVRGARSEVPETLPPTVPEKLSIPSATPYSVTEVPRMGISAVAL